MTSPPRTSSEPVRKRSLSLSPSSRTNGATTGEGGRNLDDGTKGVTTSQPEEGKEGERGNRRGWLAHAFLQGVCMELGETSRASLVLSAGLETWMSLALVGAGLLVAAGWVKRPELCVAGFLVSTGAAYIWPLLPLFFLQEATAGAWLLLLLNSSGERARELALVGATGQAAGVGVGALLHWLFGGKGFLLITGLQVGWAGTCLQHALGLEPLSPQEGGDKEEEVWDLQAWLACLNPPAPQILLVAFLREKPEEVDVGVALFVFFSFLANLGLAWGQVRREACSLAYLGLLAGQAFLGWRGVWLLPLEQALLQFPFALQGVKPFIWARLGSALLLLGLDSLPLPQQLHACFLFFLITCLPVWAQSPSATR